MLQIRNPFSLFPLLLILSCAAPSQGPQKVSTPSSAPPPYVAPVFHSNKTVTREELYQNARVPAHRDFPLSKKVKPCDDFYEYVCSEVKSHFTLPDDRSRHAFTFSDPAERLLAAKKNILTFFQTKPHLTSRQNILKTNYNACLNRTARAKEEKQFVARELAQLNAVKNLTAFQRLMSQRILTSDLSIVGFNPAGDDITDHDKYSVDFSTGAMTLPERSYYADPAVRAATIKLFSLFFKTIGRDNSDSRALKLMDFETQIAKIKPLPAEMRPRSVDPTYIVSKNDLLTKYPALMLTPPLDKIPKDIHIFNMVPELTSFMNETLSHGDLELLKDYILFHALSGLMDEGYPEYFNARFQFSNKFLGGAAQRPELYERCANFVDGSFNFELSAELLDLLYTPDTQAKVEAITDKIRATKLKEINETKWISEQGRAGALDKMRKLRLMIFKPKQTKDWDFNATGVVYKPDMYIQNQKNVAMANMWRDYGRLKTKRNHDKWGMSPTTVNAYYSPPDNQFVLPAAIFQEPFYVEGASEHLNIGSIGSVTGHEIGHSIDDQGAKFDAKGEIRQWMSDTDLKAFHKLADEKLVNLFDHIMVGDMPHNGKLTLGENIGDNVGIHSAYRTAFENMGNAKPEELKKMKREFFEQYARIWCYVARPKYVEAQLKTNPHSLGEGRANGQVVQMDGFYEAYSCKPGDKMYVAPEERVKIW